MLNIKVCVVHIVIMRSVSVSVSVPVFTHLVFSGGGFLGLTYIGIIRYLQQEGLDKHIKTVAGSSIGAVFAIVFAMGIETNVLEDEFSQLNEDFATFDLQSILQITGSLGLTTGNGLVAKLSKHLGNKTFVEFVKQTGKHLVICATHVGTMKPVYFSVDTTPHVRVIDAVRASTAIPILVAPVKIGDEYYIDGAVTHNLPVRCIPTDVDVHKDSVLIVSVSDASSYGFDMSAMSNNGLHTDGVTRVMTYVMRILQAATNDMQSHQLLSSTYTHYMYINDAPVGRIEFTMNEETNVFRANVPDRTTVEKCMLHGYNKMHSRYHQRQPSST